MHRHTPPALVAACSLAAALIALSAQAQRPETPVSHRHDVMAVVANLDAASRSGSLDAAKLPAAENARGHCRNCHAQ